MHTIRFCFTGLFFQKSLSIMPAGMGGRGAADFKVGVQTGFASGASERKFFCTPTFPNVR